MKNIKMIIQYDGTRYKGWQRLGNDDNTIQGKIEAVLSKMTGETVEIVGSGRTDAGVHAENQIANFQSECRMSDKEMMDYCYEYLPEDIVIKSIKQASNNFHSRYNAIGKRYTYYIDNNKYHDVFTKKYAYHVDKPLNIEKMKDAADILIGKHDFQSFTTLKSKKNSTVREIYSIEIINNDGNIKMIFHGDGFMKNMVRILVGTIVEIGLGEKQVSEIIEILDKTERKYSGHMAPAKGLFLTEVYY